MPNENHEKKKPTTISLPIAVTVLAGIASVFLTLFIDIKSTLSLIESRYEERTTTANAWLRRMDEEQKRARNTRAELREMIAKIAEKVTGQEIIDAELLITIKTINRLDAHFLALNREVTSLSNVLKEHIDLRGHPQSHKRYPFHVPKQPGPF